MSTEAEEQPFLRTLSPLLRNLERQLRQWLEGSHLYPVSIVHRAEIEGLAEDLQRKSLALDVERPLLVIMLMGGTGVGKSTLLNALSGSSIAQASFTRPTTRDPVVYFHQTIPADRLDPKLRLCRLSQHNRDTLLQKVIVDTPDLDSNDLANREKLIELLPVADIVLYVGSQEKYHDQLGWELFKQQRKRRAFAFVLNKWDRCIDAGVGVRPDDDLIQDLKAEGFANPKLFRTTAQLWIDAEKAGQKVPPDLPPGEQFVELCSWLEQGLTRLEIEAVKARGVGQLVQQSEQLMSAVTPPDFANAAARVRTRWNELLNEEAEQQAEVLVSTLEPYQAEVEHHFSVRGQQRFWGLMAAYLGLTTKVWYFGNTLRDRIPLSSKMPKAKVQTPDQWDVTVFVQSCTAAATERTLVQRQKALANRLLIEGDQRNFPLDLLSARTQYAAKQSWDERYSRSLLDTLTEVEHEVTHPTGWRKYLRGGITTMANVLPTFVLLSSIILILYRFFVDEISPSLAVILMPVYLTLGTLIVLHVLISLLLPVSWTAIREEFRERLQEKLVDVLQRGYNTIPDDVSTTIRQERQSAEKIVQEAKQVSAWLEQREQSSHISELYGSEAI